MPSPAGALRAPRLRMEDIHKGFPGVQALAGVSLEVEAGEVHVLLGENGAGKSTLMNILGGGCTRDAGTIALDGEDVALATPAEARNRGIAIIHQELMLVPELSVAENMFLGRLPQRAGIVRRDQLNALAAGILHALDPGIDVRQPVHALRLGQQQLVEIARALSQDARVLVMDEPTSALTDRETARLFEVIRTLTARGVAVIYISHRMDELFAIGDRVSVLRDGVRVDTRPMASADRAELIRLMANRDVEESSAQQDHGGMTATADARLSVQQLSRAHVLHDISFTVHAGEIVGVAGLLGAGRTELARAIFGVDPCEGGTIRIDGRVVTIRSPRDAIAAGIGFVTEDRKREGLLLDRSIRENVALPVLRRVSRWGVMKRRAERALADDAIRTLRIRSTGAEQSTRTLSGGNQQKVVLAKWLATGARVLLLDEPTRGVDVGGKQEIHAQIARLASEGAAVLLLSSDLPELLALADRTLVLRDGRIAGTYTRDASSAAVLMACAVGH